MATTTGDTDVATAGSSKFGWLMLSVLRIGLGFVFLWAFLDKLFGLGFATCRKVAEDGSFTISTMCFNPETGSGAWLKGGHVTEGYLVYGGNPNSPFHDFFVNLGADRWTDWPFMIGLLGVGLALMLGIGTRIGAWAGAAMLLFMYMTQMWPANNPILDSHIAYIIAIFAIVWLEFSRQSLGLGGWWRKLPIVKKNPWLV